MKTESLVTLAVVLLYVGAVAYVALPHIATLQNVIGGAL